LTSPVPVEIAKAMGADIVIAVDIAAKPKGVKVKDSIDMLLQTFAIMGQTISTRELAEADVVIQPHIGGIGSADFDQKNLAILEGEKAAQAALPAIRQILQKKGWRSPGAAPR
jgi:NTE family protein